MNKNAKGAIAVGAATLLLLGGGGTLAVWNAQDSVTGGTIYAGQLSLAGGDTAEGAWYPYSDTGETDCTWYETGGTELAENYTLVPGDDVIFCVTGLELTAQGGNLFFTVAGDDGTVTVLDENGDPVDSGDVPAGVTTTAGVTAGESTPEITPVTTVTGDEYTGVGVGVDVYNVTATDGVVTVPISAYVRVSLDVDDVTGTEAQQWTFTLGDDSTVDITQVVAAP